jgi:hypothetical protein
MTAYGQMNPRWRRWRGLDRAEPAYDPALARLDDGVWVNEPALARLDGAESGDEPALALTDPRI